MQLTKIPARKSGVSMEEMDGDLILFNPASEKVLYFNPSAAVVWQLCDGTRSVGEIAAILAEAYPDAAEKMQEQVSAVVETFAAHEAIDLR
jgi:hypothetical protein